MSKIRHLTAEVASIPDKEKRKNQVGSLEAARDKLRALTEAAIGASDVCAAVGGVNGATFVVRVRQVIVQSGSSAKQLNAHLAKGGQIAGNKKADELLTSISERVSNAVSLVRKGWSGLAQGYALKYQPLADVAKQIGLPGAPVLERALNQVRYWETDPPTSAEAAKKFDEAVDQIRVSIESLGFEGKAGAFMVAAANGNAKARDLLDPDVGAFLSKYPDVWALLQVRL